MDNGWRVRCSFIFSFNLSTDTFVIGIFYINAQLKIDSNIGFKSQISTGFVR